MLEGNIKEVYLMTKIWKAHFGGHFKSYAVKKLLLDPSRREHARESRDNAFRELMLGPLRGQANPRGDGETYFKSNVEWIIEENQPEESNK